MNNSNIVMIVSYKTVNHGVFTMNGTMSSEINNESDIKTESVDAFRFFIQRGLYG
jgi:hypothetical protein